MTPKISGEIFRRTKETNRMGTPIVRSGHRETSSSWGENALGLFAALQTFSLTRASFELVLGGWTTAIAGYLNFGSVIVLVSATWWFVRRHGLRLPLLARFWLAAVLTLVVINAARGYVQGLATKAVTADTLSFLVILSFVVLGSIPRAFETIRRIWFWVLLAAIPLNLVALTDLTEMTQELSGGVRIARETISYRTQNALDVVILCAAFAFQYPLWKRVVIAGGFSLVVLQQILYQKRLETAFLILVLMVIGSTWLSTEGKLKMEVKRSMRNAAAGIAVLLGMAVLLKSEYIVPQIRSLGDRLGGETAGGDTSGGLLRYIFLDNERAIIVRESLATLKPWELGLGRGMGGGVELNRVDSGIVNSVFREKFWDSYFLEDYGYFGRRGFEIGLAVPILKGGFLLWMIYYMGHAAVVLHAGVIRRTFTGRMAWALVCLYLFYTCYGGDFALSMTFQLASAASCLGCCFAFMGNQEGASVLRRASKPAKPKITIGEGRGATVVHRGD